MEVNFLGVGEAFDERLPNTSILIRIETERSPVVLLLDCGFTAPSQFWKQGLGVDELDGIWISHFHGDHFFGIPAMLVRFWEEGRRKELAFLGQAGIEKSTRDALDLAYQGFSEKIGFPVRFIEIEPNNLVEIFGISFRTVENVHSKRDLALRIDAGGKSVYYSGDGRPTPEGVELARGCSLIIQEAFHTETEIPGHSTVTQAIAMGKECEALNLALVHIHRDVRKQLAEGLGTFKQMALPLNLVLPEPGFRVWV
ncbi:MAG: ribonuclease Z [Pseudomonadota bacterium]